MRTTGIAADAIDLVGFHGQTVFHDPARALTVQIGDGQALADRLGVPVVWDLRADDVAAGGQGAPLVPVYHRALAATAGLAGPVAFLNLGGVANVTFIGADGALIAFDTGPGNALLDDWMRRRTGTPFDAEGRLAASGTASAAILSKLARPPLFRAAAAEIARPRQLRARRPGQPLRCRRGRHAAALFGALRRRRLEAPAGAARGLVRLRGRAPQYRADARCSPSCSADAPVQPVEALGFDGDAIEAQAFAFLAVRAADGKPISFPLTTGVPEPLERRAAQPAASVVNLRSSFSQGFCGTCVM